MRAARLKPASVYAAELGITVEAAERHFRVRLWERPTPAGKGRSVGELPPGSRVDVLVEDAEDYRIRAPDEDGRTVEGFINKMHFEGEPVPRV